LRNNMGEGPPVLSVAGGRGALPAGGAPTGGGGVGARQRRRRSTYGFTAIFTASFTANGGIILAVKGGWMPYEPPFERNDRIDAPAWRLRNS
jgi:hypothetical protein